MICAFKCKYKVIGAKKNLVKQDTSDYFYYGVLHLPDHDALRLACSNMYSVQLPSSTTHKYVQILAA